MKLLCLFLVMTLTAAASGRRNFLLIVTDDQRWDTVGVNDPKVALPTPQIDRLAKEGINFENGFVTTPICAVSRACILSGRYSRNNGIHEFLIPMTDTVFASSYDKNTIIVFISDHGTHYGEKKLGGKWTPYDQSLRVPFFLYDPRPDALEGVRLPQIALNIDIAPTVLDLAGVEVPPAMDGRSLAPLVRGAKPVWREHFFYEHQTSPVGVARPHARFMGVRSLTENYVRWTDEKPVSKEYYDLPNDSWEINNLINIPERLGKISRLRGFFTEWEKQNPNTYTYNPYGPRPQTNAPDIDWERYRRAWPPAYKKIAAEVKRLGVSWDDSLNHPETREAIGKATGWYY